MAQYFLDLVYSLTTCMSCFPSSPNLTINHRSFKILRLLGEGGFSYVYLVQDNAGDLYALKKIRCTYHSPYPPPLAGMTDRMPIKAPSVKNPSNAL